MNEAKQLRDQRIDFYGELEITKNENRCEIRENISETGANFF